jgi:hypothetical protein
MVRMHLEIFGENFVYGALGDSGFKRKALCGFSWTSVNCLVDHGDVHFTSSTPGTANVPFQIVLH